MSQPPVRNAGYGAGQIHRHIATLVQIAQQAAQHRDDELCMTGTYLVGMAQNELMDILGTERIELYGTGAKTFGKESANDGQVVEQGCRG